MASFDENGKYIKTNWKAGDKITATKLNKIEESIEAVNDNDISRYVEADARLDALEAKDVAHDKEFTNVRNLIADNKAAAELGDYEINSRMTFLENELNEGIEEVHNVAETVDGKMEAMLSEVDSEINTLKDAHEEMKKKDIVYVDDFIVGHDHTQAFIDAIKFCKAWGNNTLKTRGRKYSINKRILIDFPLNIDFNDCTIEYDIPEDFKGYYRHRGVFSFVGKEVVSVNVTNFEPKLQYQIESGMRQTTSRVTCDNTSDLAVGDFVKLDLPFSENIHSIDTYKPTVKILTKIVKIDNELNQVYLEYHSPFDFTLVDITGATLTKVDCLENIDIKNAKFVNLTNIDEVTNADRYYAPIILHMVANFNIENIKSEKGVHSTLVLDYCSHGDIRNIETIKPKVLSAGLGYGMQIASSMRISVDKSVSIHSRHNVDFSMSAFCECSNSRGSNATNGAFDVHGICEHDISFNNCCGDIYLGNSSTQFPCLSTDIQFNNHVGNFSGCICEKLSISNSDVAFMSHMHSYFNELYITNSKLRFYDKTSLHGANRGKQKHKRLKIVNSTIDSVDVHTDTYHFDIDNFDFVDLINNHVIGAEGKYLRLRENYNINMTQNTFIDTNFLLLSTDKNINYRIYDNLMIDNTSNALKLIRMQELNGCTGLVAIENNDVRVNKAKTIIEYPKLSNTFVFLLRNNIIRCQTTSIVNISSQNTNVIQILDNMVTNTRFDSMPNSFTFTPLGTTPYILARIATEPTPVRGSIYFNSTTGKIMKCNDGKNWEEI